MGPDAEPTQRASFVGSTHRQSLSRPRVDGRKAWMPARGAAQRLPEAGVHRSDRPRGAHSSALTLHQESAKRVGRAMPCWPGCVRALGSVVAEEGDPGP